MAFAIGCGAASQLAAQVVQLPTFEFFSVSTTVVVPDRGSASLGGISGSSMGSTRNGLPLAGHLPGLGPLTNNRTLARGDTTGGVSVSAWIHDQEEMDTAILGMPLDEFQRQVRGAARNAPGEALAKDQRFYPLPRVDVNAAQTLTERERLAATAAREQAAKASANLELARSAAARGKTKLALAYYRIAVGNAGGAAKTELTAEMAALAAQANAVAALNEKAAAAVPQSTIASVANPPSQPAIPVAPRVSPSGAKPRAGSQIRINAPRLGR